MQEGTAIGLMTVVSMVGFGLLFGLMLLWLPKLKEANLNLIENGINNTPHYQ